MRSSGIEIMIREKNMSKRTNFESETLIERIINSFRRQILFFIAFMMFIFVLVIVLLAFSN